MKSTKNIFKDTRKICQDSNLYLLYRYTNPFSSAEGVTGPSTGYNSRSWVCNAKAIWSFL